ncbi:hypothetical protein QQS21_004491 [Conoideocrella luteorostrata]|uniref:Riboflavin kinase n=1 Tax=Conoideocrella luteorostrata TaxID=1105319 RepID=A0AAJ0FUN1_9HYPO|nr:hypothetical protein QQS21_004491 [Conoideocrella luteorostrata]
MEEARAWSVGRRPQTSRAATVVPVSSPHHVSTNPRHQHRHHQPPPSPLRPSRSAAQLRQQYHSQDAPPLPPVPPLPPPPHASSFSHLSEDFLPPPPPYQVRRTQSSSALSVAATTTTTTYSSSPQPGPSKWKTALGEAQFIAGGLISRPAESTRHYTIIRHSHGLVWYKGPKTSISITILTDGSVPPNRTVWLQEKGYSGNMGMSLKAFMGSRGKWIDVTPIQEARAEHIPEMEERGIQRDIKRFVKKASGRLKKHVARETHVLRIPASASDGYFRLVLCGGDDDPKKTLCGSPVFRIASTSTDVSVVRGASLTTMPIEMGVKVASTVGTQIVKKYTGIAGAVVQSQAGKFAAKQSVKRAAAVAHKGYHGVGGNGLQNTVQDSWRRNRQDSHGRLLDEATLTTPILDVLGSDEGPEKPFPIKFDGRVSRGTGRSSAELGIPTANLKDVPDHITSRLGGVFAAWAAILPARGTPPDSLSTDWHEAIVTIAPPRDAPPSVAMRNKITVYMATEFDAFFFDSRLKVLLMGYLRPAALYEATTDERLAQHEQDVFVTIASLGRDDWLPHETITRMKTLKSTRSFGDRLDEATGRVQQTVDRIPLHWAGVRSESALARDAMIGKGGMWVRR